MNGEFKIMEHIIRKSVIVADKGITPEVKACIDRLLKDGYGDYIFIQLEAETPVFKKRGWDPEDIYFIVYKHNNGEWKKVYEGMEYPEAVTECI